MSTFICKVCGKGHEGVYDPPPDIAPAPEQVEALKAAWLEAEAKLDKSPNNEHFAKAAQKAGFAYYATIPSKVEKLPPTITTRKGRDGLYFVCVWHDEKDKPADESPRVELKEATEGFLWSTQTVRSSVFVPAGVHVLRATHTFLRVEVKDENGCVVRISKACENGEEWVDLEAGGQVYTVITKTAWGPTPFGKALKPAKEDEPERALEPWVAPPRCGDCNAIVHPDHLAEHRQYRCQPGLHQPPASGVPS